MRPPPAQRPGNIWLWTSALLFALFAMLAVAIYIAEYDEIIVDQGEKEALTGTEFVRPTPPPSPDLSWPQWRGRNRDGVAWTSTPLDSLPDKVLWDEPAGRGFGSCAVVGDRFYTLRRDNDQEVVLCRNTFTGKEIWRHSYATPWPRGIEPDYGHGPRSTPTVVGDLVYTLGITGILQCRKADQGDLVWQKELLANATDVPKWGIACSPLVDGDRVIVVPGGAKGAVVAMDRHTGYEVWVSSGLVGPPGYSSPVVAEFDGSRQVVVVTGKDLAGLDVTSGRLLWSYHWPTQYEVNAASPLAFQTLSGDKPSHYVFITSGYNQGCALLRITRENDGFAAHQVFRSKRMASQISTPVRHGNHVYGFDEGTLTCLDLRTGERRWRQSGFDRGSLLLTGDRLVILGENGTLALAEANPEAYHEIDRRQPFGDDRPRCWTMPVIAGDHLYLRGQPGDNGDSPGKWICLDLKGAAK